MPRNSPRWYSKARQKQRAKHQSESGLWSLQHICKSFKLWNLCWSKIHISSPRRILLFLCHLGTRGRFNDAFQPVCLRWIWCCLRKSGSGAATQSARVSLIINADLCAPTRTMVCYDCSLWLKENSCCISSTGHKTFIWEEIVKFIKSKTD